jgi:Tol biopolymer transport system component
MKSILIGLASALLLVSALAFGAQKQADVERQLKTAMNTELVDRNLKAAIEQYKKVVDSGIRPLAAQALIHMAECYQKLGDAESQKVYQRIVSEFADQKDAVTIAQARLGGTTGASAKGDRAVWNGPNLGFGHVSADGRFITGWDRNTGRLLIHDSAGNMDRVLTPPTPNHAARESVISRDGKQVVYVWWDFENSRAGFRVAPLRANGFLEPRQFFLATDDLADIDSFDWSPDGKWVAAVSHRKDGTGQIELIALADGSLRVLKSMDWNVSDHGKFIAVPDGVFFSVDSKYIAYDLPSADGTNQRDVFVLPLDGNREIPAVVHSANEAVMGWSPDGTRLLFSSDRTGSVSLWALPFADGKVQGEPEMVRPDIGASISLGLTASGALYVYKRVSTRDMAIAPIDVEAGKLLGPPVSFSQGFVEGALYPQWSPDSKYLAYPACNNSCIAIRTVATGQVRVLPTVLHAAQTPNWSPDGRSLLVHGSDLRERQGIFEIDAQSGELTAVILSDGIAALVQFAPDGRKVYFNRNGVLVERNTASGAERDVYRDAAGGGTLSPDGKYFAVARMDPSTKTAGLLLVPVAGDQPRELLRLMPPEGFGWGHVWTPDSAAVIFDKNTGTRRELWLVSIAGDKPRKLDIDPDIWLKGSGVKGQQGFSLSPDGRSIAFQMGKAVNEVWALENFLPAPAAKK